MNLTIHGARCWLYINGRRFGRVFSFSYNINSPKKVIGGIDTVTPVELAYTSETCTFQMGLYRTMGDAGIEGMAMNGWGLDGPRTKYFSILLIDSLSQYTLFQCDYCVTNGQSWTNAVKQYTTGVIQGSGIGPNNEVAPLRR